MTAMACQLPVAASPRRVFTRSFSSFASFGAAVRPIDLLSVADVRAWARSSAGQAAIQTGFRGQGPLVAGVPAYQHGSGLRVGRKRETAAERLAADTWLLAGQMADGRNAARVERLAGEASPRLHVDTDSIDAARERKEAIERIAARNARYLGGRSIPVRGLGKIGQAGLARVNRSLAGADATAARERAKSARWARQRAKWAMDTLKARVAVKEPEIDPLWVYVRDIARSASRSAVQSVRGGQRRKDSAVQSLGAQCGVSASGHVRVETEGGWRGGGSVVSDASEAEALSESIGSAWQAMHRLTAGLARRAGSLPGVTVYVPQAMLARTGARLLPPAGSCWASRTMGGARWRWVRREAWRGAYRSLTGLACGMTGDRAAGVRQSLRVVDLDTLSWGHGSEDSLAGHTVDSEGQICPVYDLDRAQAVEQWRAECNDEGASRPCDYERAELMAMSRLVGSQHWRAMLFPSAAGHNERLALDGALRCWRLACRLLRGQHPAHALAGEGLSRGWLETGRLRRDVLAPLGWADSLAALYPGVRAGE